jgi:hypothetical protein
MLEDLESDLFIESPSLVSWENVQVRLLTSLGSAPVQDLRQQASGYALATTLRANIDSADVKTSDGLEYILQWLEIRQNKARQFRILLGNIALQMWTSDFHRKNLPECVIRIHGMATSIRHFLKHTPKKAGDQHVVLLGAFSDLDIIHLLQTSNYCLC